MRKYYNELIPNEEDKYTIESKWEELINSTPLSDIQRQQQFYIHEFISTESNYVQKLHVLSQVSKSPKL